MADAPEGWDPSIAVSQLVRGQGAISAGIVEGLDNKLKVTLRKGLRPENPQKPPKSPCISHSVGSLSPNSPTDSSDEANKERPPDRGRALLDYLHSTSARPSLWGSSRFSVNAPATSTFGGLTAPSRDRRGTRVRRTARGSGQVEAGDSAGTANVEGTARSLLTLTAS